MIIYFSATGNCKHVATVLAQMTKDKALSILDLSNADLDFSSETQLGIICPTYFWGLPSIVKDFFQTNKIKSSQKTYVYFIATYGTTPGAITGQAKKLLIQQNIKINSFYGIKMADTWTPLFNLTDNKKIHKINSKAEIQILKIADSINQRKIHRTIKLQFPNFILPLATKFYEKARKTKNFYLEDSCIGCGLCEKNCPIQAIKMFENKPIWQKEKCAICLRCVHQCPKFAIQYGNGATKKHGQYTFEKYENQQTKAND